MQPPDIDIAYCGMATAGLPPVLYASTADPSYAELAIAISRAAGLFPLEVDPDGTLSLFTPALPGWTVRLPADDQIQIDWPPIDRPFLQGPMRPPGWVDLVRATGTCILIVGHARTWGSENVAVKDWLVPAVERGAAAGILHLTPNPVPSPTAVRAGERRNDFR